MRNAWVVVLLTATTSSALSAGWTPPTPVRTVDGGSASVGGHAVALDAQGNAVVAWLEGPGDTIQAAVRPAGGSFVLVSPAPSQPGAGSPRVGLDAQGNVTVAWTRGEVVQTVTGTLAGVFGSPQDIPNSGPAPTDLDLAVDGQGRTLAMWRSVSPDDPRSRPRTAQ